MQPLWVPSQKRCEASEMERLIRHLGLGDYSELYRFSIEKSDEFWAALVDFYGIDLNGDRTPVCTDKGFKNYGWYPKARLNFARELLKRGDDRAPALVGVLEDGSRRCFSYADLREKMGALQKTISPFIKSGDVLAAYMPNIPETALAMLATAGLGGVFTSTSSDFGIEGVVDRFGEVGPKVLVAATGYRYGGKTFDLMPKLIEIEKRLPTLERIILVDLIDLRPDISVLPKAQLWSEAVSESAAPIFIDTAFSAPLYIMYSSGTTGKPKCIVHSAGGTLLQHVKELGLHSDLTKKKAICYFTTCGWMMWNWLVSSLFFGSKVVLYEGSPAFPSTKDFFKIIDREELAIFGTSPKFLKALEDAGWDHESSLPTLQTILSTGSPLLPEQYDFVYNKIKKDIALSSISGGTDIIGCFMLGNPILPVFRGEIQCRGLGMAVDCVDENGKTIVAGEGELVCRQSFPSRPVSFLNDPNNEKINAAYFDHFPGLWHHGDFITITERGGVLVHGRSDATLNPGGVRIGTAEIYRQTETLSYIADSLCVGRNKDGDVDVLLFVKLKEGESLTVERIDEIKKAIRKNTTPRHVPKEIHAVTDIPYTRSGKKVELAVARIVAGKALTNIEAIANPDCLSEYRQYS
jgi:acetoacetyl-CoA synthetase